MKHGKALIIRGGALGDFILTLPAIHLFRDTYPDCSVEILGYKSAVSLAENRFYATRARCIEYGAMAGFFTKGTSLDPELCDYFAGFDVVISYLFDPDGLFEGNLEKAGVSYLLCGSGKILESSHAAFQLAKPMEPLALFLEDPAARVYPSADDLDFAKKLHPWLGSFPTLAIHPGSGSASKNMPVGNWQECILRLLDADKELRILLIGGEADLAVMTQLRNCGFPPNRVFFLQNIPLPGLAALLQLAGRFAGHDSGISHLAAAVGCRCLLVFGPTDPGVWAPANIGVRVLRAPNGDFQKLGIGELLGEFQVILQQ